MNTLRGHQGDVFFQTVEALPEAAVKVSNKPLATGSGNHAHIVTGDVDRYESGGDVYYEVRKGVLQHLKLSELHDGVLKATEVLPYADHKPHILPAGIYKFDIQNEYNPYAKAFEQVQD